MTGGAFRIFGVSSLLALPPVAFAHDVLSFCGQALTGGVLTISGRTDDVMNTGGEKVVAGHSG